jgi:hypothetical protein
VYTVNTVGVMDILRRKRISYKAGTIYADKNDPTETVLKEYVEENCGPSATMANGRLFSGVIPYFTVEGDTMLGPDWYGSRAYENLLDVCQEIAGIGAVDFDVVPNPSIPNMQFKTYVNQLGADRTNTSIGTDGKNASGNYPVIFTVDLANIQDLVYSKDRMAEYTVCHVLGDGDGATRTVITTASGAYDDSPYNAIETSVNGSGLEFDYQLSILGLEVLFENMANERFEFTPLRNPGTLYGKHYFLGDKVTLKQGATSVNKRLIDVKISVTGKEVETISHEFADVP